MTEERSKPQVSSKGRGPAGGRPEAAQSKEQASAAAGRGEALGSIDYKAAIRIAGELRSGAKSWFHAHLWEREIPNLRAFYENRDPVIWFVALLIGIGVGYLAIAFRVMIALVQLPWLGTASERVSEAASQLPWIVVLLAPVAGGLIVGAILHHLMPGRRAHGVGDVIEARALRDCNIDTRTGVLSAIVAAISLGSGASAGREGPVVHLGATLAAFIENFFNLSSHHRRTLLACGVAAAVSASFNAPIAGVLFAHEVILAHYSMSAFVPIVIASVGGTLIARIHLGNSAAFVIPDYEITSFLEFPAFALLGLTCALVAIIFQSSLIATDRLARSVRVPIWTRPAIGGLMVGILAVFFPQILGVGYDATDAALHQKYSIGLLLALLVAKTAATSITLASRFGGGIFSPALYLGAMTGGAFGLIAASAFPEVASSNGLYAILGMGAVASAVLGAPLSTTLIVFELTGGYGLTIALLLSVSIAHGLTHAVHAESFFQWQMHARGVFLRDGPHMEILRCLHVHDFLRPAGEDDELQPGEDGAEPVYLVTSDTLESALQAFERHGIEHIAVVDDADSMRLIGWADHVAALAAYNEALVEAHIEEHR